MRVPTPDKNGIRWYGRNSIAVDGTREDPTRCIKEVPLDKRHPYDFVQCRYRRRYGPGNAYCHKHDPAQVAAVEQAKRDEWSRRDIEDRNIESEGGRLARVLGLSRTKAGVYWAKGHARRSLVVPFEELELLIERMKAK